MLEIGKTFNKNGYDFCVLDLIDYYGKKYALFSKEKDNISFEFYEILENSDGYSLILVTNEELKFNLLSMVERSF